jgi:hypothetical protein
MDNNYFMHEWACELCSCVPLTAELMCSHIELITHVSLF